MKKIVINGDFLAFSTNAGVSRYALEIIKELDKIIDFQVELVTPEYAKMTIALNKIKLVKFGKRSLNLWKLFDLKAYVNSNDAILIDLTQALPFMKNSITCIHDCIPELVPSAYNGLFNKTIRKSFKLFQRKRAINNSIELITVSEFSKMNIIDYYHINPEKIIVIGNGWQHILRVKSDDSLLKKHKLNENEFFFTLGSRVKHKNLPWIVAAAKQNLNYKFVVSGENKYAEKNELAELPKNIIFTGYISDEQIKSLMTKCKAFLFPSFYEGFGIPPMEALALGTRVIISNKTCLPEIYRNSAYYIDPYDYSHIDLDRILERKVESPDNVLNMYSWEKSAKLLYDLILKVN